MADGGLGYWLARHKWLTALAVLLLISWASNAGADETRRGPGPYGGSAGVSGEREGAGDRRATRAARGPGRQQKADREPERAKVDQRGRSAVAGEDRASKPRPRPTAPPVPTALVTRVIDGDTVELSSGHDVRLVGIDTPEVGECGYDRAAANLASLVEGRQVTLTRPTEDRDQYGRLLRYLDIGDIDPGLRLIKNGLAIARYDSRDGYGFHPREPVYVAADRASADMHCPKPKPKARPQPLVARPVPSGGCAPGYSPCVPPSPPDVDCADVDGPIRVTGSDPHGLDADGDGVACE